MISILMMPIISRLVGPAAYGDYSVYLSTFIIFSTFVSCKFDQGIIVAETDEDSRRMFILTIRTLFVVVPLSVIAYGIFAFASGRSGGAKPWWWLLIPALLASGWNNAALQVANREGRFKDLSRSRLSASLGMNGASMALSAGGLGAIGLAIGHLVSFVLSSARLVKLGDFIQWNQKIKLADSISCAKRNYQYPFYLVPSELIGNVVQQLPVFVFSAKGDSSVVGYYTLCQRLIGLPFALLVSSISSVLKERFIRERDASGNCVPLFLKMSLLLGGISLAISLPLFLIADWFVPFFFGQEWAPAAFYLKWSLLPFSFRFFVSPLTYVFLVYKKQSLDLIMQTVSFVITGLTFFVTLRGDGSITKALIGYSIAASVLYISYYIVSLSVVIANRREDNA